MIVATSHRLLLACIDTNKKELVDVAPVQYADVERFTVRKRDITVTSGGQDVTAKLVQKGKVDGLLAAVQERVAAGVVVA
jgi:hypothetical protein